jgi:GNAT superfamily N-acetyltransferase
MPPSVADSSNIRIHPATADRWPDLEALFGPHGASGGCWCLWWRLHRPEFKRLAEPARRDLLHALTGQTPAPGVLAYVDGKPAGWCAVGPREHFHALEASRTLKRVDDQPVWAIVCYFVARGYRHRGLMLALLRGAVDYARSQGATIVEGYPTDLQAPKLAGKKLTGAAGYMGIASAFRAAGFVEVGRASETQLIMRCAL